MCALTKEVAMYAKEMAGEKETACCVRSYHKYKDIWAAVTGEFRCVIVGKIFIVKLYSHKIFVRNI